MNLKISELKANLKNADEGTLIYKKKADQAEKDLKEIESKLTGKEKELEEMKKQLSDVTKGKGGSVKDMVK